MTAPKKKDEEIKFSPCPKCSRTTGHDILYKHTVLTEIKEIDAVAWDTFEIVRCRGCHDVHFRHVEQFTEDIDPETGDLIDRITVYPEPRSGRFPMAEVDRLPMKIKRVYLECLKALNSSANILCAIGLRAVIEAICMEQEVKGKNLQDRIEELVRTGLVAKKQAEFLHLHRFLGNTAAHDIEPPEDEGLAAALDSIEIMLKTVYVLPALAEIIKKKSSSKATQDDDA